MDTNTFTLSSGRVVGVTEFGNRESSTVVVLAHPAPGSSAFDPDPIATAAHQVRVIAVDRPGYGMSTLDPGHAPTVQGAADDIAEYLADQGIRSAAAAGWSAGGRVALALAASHPSIVDRVAVIATPAPDAVVPWVGEDNRAMVESFRSMPPHEAILALTGMLDEFMGAEPVPGALINSLATAGVDDAIAAEAHDRLAEMLRLSAAQGNLGTAADIISYTLLDWGFDPLDVRADAFLFYGAKDPDIGPEHAAWYADQIASAEVEIVVDVGHMLVVPAWEQVLTRLVGAPSIAN
jgi:pimeloyl-ACP methyl ester carboxylesterase